MPQDILGAPPEIYFEHDRVLRNDYFHAGGGVTYQLATLDLYANSIGFAGGRNTHEGWALSFGVSWPFEVGTSAASAP